MHWTVFKLVILIPGDEVQVVLQVSIDDTSLYVSTQYLYNEFNGFRL